jgi:catechol 2,3-dioxygenase-like lactoylglutathione lyase family enzyme
METIISGLLSRFEQGSITRRDLVRGLAMLAAAGSSETAAHAQSPAALGTKIDHVSIQVTDLPRSIAFYQQMFGLTVVSEDKPNEIVRLGSGKSVFVSLHHKNPTGIVDHFAIAVRNFNRDSLTSTLRERGANPSQNLDAGFHILDPEGISVQIMSE